MRTFIYFLDDDDDDDDDYVAGFRSLRGEKPDT